MISVKVEIPRRKKPGSSLRAFQRSASAVGYQVGVGRALKRRVARRGRPVTPFRGYVRGGRRFVNPAYPQTSGGIDTPAGVIFDNSAAFHAAQGTRRGSFSVSGGMWRGLSVVPRGAGSARLQFRGRSPGQAQRRLKSGRISRAKVSNALKAQTVLDSTSVNIVENTRRELDSIAQATEALQQVALEQATGLDIKWVSRSRRGDPVMVRDIIAAVRTSRRVL